MGKQTKVSCVSCEGEYYISDESLIPANVEKGVAFESKCPWCDDGNYAVLPKP